MSNRRELAQSALRAALRFRAKAGANLWTPINPLDASAQMGIEVRFAEIPSLEGMYWKRTRPVILLGSDRPPGRQMFTCAHEIGHHIFGHGTRIDEVSDETAQARRNDPDEYLANLFAAFALMPKSAIEHAFAKRGLSPANSSPAQLFALATFFGVGYATLIKHLRFTLSLISAARAKELLRQQPKAIRAELLAQSADSDLIVVDSYWDARPIDMQVGDYALLPSGTQTEGQEKLRVQKISSGSVSLKAEKPGIDRLVRGDWAVFVRISRRRFVGRAIFRHLEEADD